MERLRLRQNAWVSGKNEDRSGKLVGYFYRGYVSLVSRLNNPLRNGNGTDYKRDRRAINIIT